MLTQRRNTTTITRNKSMMLVEGSIVRMTSTRRKRELSRPKGRMMMMARPIKDFVSVQEAVTTGRQLKG